MAERYWLMKSEPHVCSIDDLERKRVDSWEGVRNYQARNFMRDHMKVGDGVLFYHSSVNPPGVAGLARVAREAYPDATAFDPASVYYDAASDAASPTWMMVDVEFVEKFPALVPLAVLQKTSGLEDMMVTRKGMRLSVQPVTPAQWNIVVALGRQAVAAPAEPEQQSLRSNRSVRSIRGGGAKKTARPVRVS